MFLLRRPVSSRPTRPVSYIRDGRERVIYKVNEANGNESALASFGQVAVMMNIMSRLAGMLVVVQGNSGVDGTAKERITRTFASVG